ncbi:MAG TPA: hypothetical protein VLI67_00350, partial [Vicinamibacteria bacterium]|nr:hypothetical protein [Vicinamibacteria bacterium]
MGLARMLAVLFAFAASAAVPDLQLVGVVIAGDAERSVAILRSEGRTRVTAVGDTAFGGRLLAVSPAGATL